MSYLDELLNNGHLSLCDLCIDQYRRQGKEVEQLSGYSFHPEVVCIVCLRKTDVALCRVTEENNVVRQ